MNLWCRFSILMKGISGASEKHFFTAGIWLLRSLGEERLNGGIPLVIMSTSSTSMALPASGCVVVWGSSIMPSPNRDTRDLHMCVRISPL